jgi:hypothetical protein
MRGLSTTAASTPPSVEMTKFGYGRRRTSNRKDKDEIQRFWLRQNDDVWVWE